MKTYALDKCLNVLSYHTNNDELKIGVLASMDTNFSEEFVEPFRRELGLNLLTKPTFQEKKDLIVFYIDELDHAIFIEEDHVNIEPVDFETDGLIYPIWYAGQYESDALGISKVRAHYLFSLLFMIIQDYCNLYKIPFLEICNDRFFLLDSIDLFPTREREEMLDFNKSTKEQQECKQLNFRPIFTPESVPEIFDILKDYFSHEDQLTFLSILHSGENAPTPLLFLDSGNRLADVFKQLYDSDIIRGCQKKELEYWISLNFSFRYRNKVKKYSLDYLSEIISTTKDLCQNPILNIRQEKVTGKYLISKL